MNTVMSSYVPPAREGVRDTIIRPLYDVAINLHKLGYVGPGQRVRFGHDFAMACRTAYDLTQHETECLAHDVITRIIGG